MRITRVVLNFTETCNLGDYSNTKPSLELMADLEPGDDVQAVISQLSDIAKESLRTKIDEELEQVGRPAKYSTEPRFDLFKGTQNEYPFVAIIPTQLEHDFGPVRAYRTSRGVRYAVATKEAAEVVGANNWHLFDCRDGDLTNLLAFLGEKKIAYDQAREELRKKEEERRREWLEREHRIQAEQEQEEEEEDFDEEDDEESDDE